VYASTTLLERLALAAALCAGWGYSTLALFAPDRWHAISGEDVGPEFLSPFALIATAVASFYVALLRRRGWARIPLILFSLFCLFAAGEEVSWGQRIFDRQATGIFAERNVQHETNLHNFIPPPWDGILGGILVFGFLLSPLIRKQPLGLQIRNLGVPWPQPRHSWVLSAAIFPLILLALFDRLGLEEAGELAAIFVALAVVVQTCTPRACGGSA